MRYGGLRDSGVVAPSATGIGPVLSHTAVRLIVEASKDLVEVWPWNADAHADGTTYAGFVRRHLFDEVEDVVRGMAPDGLGDLQISARRWGIKVWFGSAAPQRVHYEAQLIRRAQFDDGEGWALEIGFHAELKDEARNEAELAGLMECESEWLSQLGGDPEAGPFLGNPKWRRVSEVWLDPEMDDPDTGFEIGSRLVDYLDALEPFRHR